MISEHSCILCGDKAPYRESRIKGTFYICGRHAACECECALLRVLSSRRTVITSKAQVAVLAGYSASSSIFRNAVGSLRSQGLVEGEPAELRITINGIDTIGPVALRPQSGKALLDDWCASLGKAEVTLLQTLAQFPEGLLREQLAETSGYSMISSSFRNALGRCRSLGLVKHGPAAEPLRLVDELRP